MGANFIIAAAILLQSSQSDTAANTSPSVQHSDTTLSSETPHGFGFERLSDLLQYNRVQGLALGLGYRVPVPGVRLTALYGTVRYGFSDDRVTGRLTVLRDARQTRLVLSGYREVADIDPFSRGRTLTNTFNALLAGHDNGDYLLARGGSAALETSIGVGLELGLTARIERQNTLPRTARSAINDFLGGTGLFPPNAPAKEGVFAVGGVRLSGFGILRWNLNLDVTTGAGQSTARLFGDIRRSLGSRRGVTLWLKAGAGTEPALPQSLFRLGGLSTVRGFDYGTLRAAGFWAVQMDLAPVGRRIRPVVFVDAGQASRLSTMFSSTALVGGGAGLSLLGGLVRLDFSHPITPDLGGRVRFDLVIQGVR